VTHYYRPSAIHMGDCDVCGNLQQSPVHIGYEGTKMTARAKEVKTAESHDLVTTESSNHGLTTVADDEALANQMAEEQAGLGTSDRPEDSFYPLISVLQKLSPQVDDTSQSFMAGAKAGMFWLKNYEPPLATEITVQPVTMYTEWVEWVPRERGGGMVRRNLRQPENAKCLDAARNRWQMPNGNDLKETRVWALNLVRDNALISFVLPCASTFNTFARQWHTVIRQQYEDSGKVSAPWRHLWRLTTRMRTNSQGTWWIPQFEHVRKVTSTKDLSMGFAFWKAVDSAVRKGLELTEEISRDDDDAM
jgi:hypothetical protein